MKKLFGFEYGAHFKADLYLFGIKIRSKFLYNLIFGNPLKTNCSIYNLDELLKKGTIFPHPLGICIAQDAKIGNNCVILQNVTIGVGNTGFPIIGNNVMICAGAVIVGNVNVGDNAIIGADAVVVKDVAANTIVGGVPAKFIRNISDEKNDDLAKEA